MGISVSICGFWAMSRAAAQDRAGDWAAALLDPLRACPPGLRVWNASDPTLRLAVYRNNDVRKALDALKLLVP